MKKGELSLFQDPLVSRAIRSFIPKQVFERVSRNPENLDRVGERRIVTVVFVDITGFTPFCEGRDAEEVILFLNKIFASILEPVDKYGGSIDKYMGDAAMILFGAPVFHEDDPARAVAASIEIMSKIAEFEGLSVSIGINTGSVVAGVVGNDQHREYTVIGDAVNIASRLESSASAGEIVVGTETFDKAKDAFNFSEPIMLRLKGKSELFEARVVLGRKENVSGEDAPKLVGREMIWRRLVQFAERGGNVLVVGEAGSGKTLILSHLRELLDSLERDFVSFEGAQWLENIPYAPIQAYIRGLLSSDPKKNLEKLVPDSSDFLPLLSGILGIKIPDNPKTEYLSRSEKSDILESIIVRLIAGQKEGRYIVIDNADYLDPSTQRIVASLVASGAVSIVAAVRRPPQWMLGTFEGGIELLPLTIQHTKEILRSVLGEEKISGDFADRIFQETKGNVGHIVELAKLLREMGKIRIKNGIAVLDGELSKILPKGIGNVLTARIDNLPPDAREIIRLASVLGMEFPERLLKELADKALADKGIADLLSSGFLTRSGDNLKFVSSSVLFAAYNSLFLSVRREMHTGVAKMIEKIYSGETEDFYETLAHHYSVGEIGDKAFSYNILAGRKQERRFANREALYFYGKAFATPDADVRRWHKESELLAALEYAGRLHWYDGNLEKVIELSTRARELARKAHLAALESDAINRLALANHELGRFEVAKGLYDLLIRRFKKMGKETERYLQAITNYGTLLSDLGELDKAKKLYLKGLDMVSDNPDSAGAANLLGNLAWLEAQTGALSEAEEYLRRSGEIDDRLGNLRGAAINAVNLALILRQKGDRDHEAENYRIALDIFEKIGDKRGKALCLSNLGDVDREVGDISRARKLHRESLKIGLSINDPHRISDAELGLALDDAEEGKSKSARKRIEKAYRIAQKAGDWEGEIDCGIELIRLLFRIGETDEARRFEASLREVIERYNPSALARLDEFA